ncbi:MAG TPA: hypothetical protein VFH45_10015 [Acidimicrobiales bacterium]|nr:hypothetical protein [Acidimicrobiales bacterium]
MKPVAWPRRGSLRAGVRRVVDRLADDTPVLCGCDDGCPNCGAVTSA